MKWSKLSDLEKACYGNLATFVLVLLSLIWMFSGFYIGKAPAVLTATRLGMFKYYTIDSNALMGLFALITAIFQLNLMKGKLDRLPVWIPALKLLGVVGVTLTMLVTICYLAPTMGLFRVFNNSNFFFHIVNPALSLYVFLFPEKTNALTLKHTFFGIISVLIYAVYYVAEAATHSTGNVVNKGYDWYGFLSFGLTSAFFLVPLLILITYFISFALWKISRIIYKKSGDK